MAAGQLKHQVDEQGFFLAEEPVSAAVIDKLVMAFDRSSDSAQARVREGETYALRNILESIPEVRETALDPMLLELVRPVLGQAAKPVKAILFDKTPAVNWNLRWHQDNVIAVRERRDVPGFTGWSQKVGIPHVRPPVEILQGMLATRIHIDDCSADNGALKVIPGSHAKGRLSRATSPKHRRVLHIEYSADNLPDGLEWGE